MDYGHVYRGGETEYNKRMETIYLPKAQFMIEALRETVSSDEIEKMRFLDVGAGSGYYVAAMQHLGLQATGIEISAAQVEWGGKFLPSGSLIHLQDANISERIRCADEQVVSFIGVLEHIVDLQEVLQALVENTSIKYIFFSVPMFSYSAIFESAHPNVFNRLLGGTHTHLFTNESLTWLMRQFQWELRGAWYFGTDIADLVRMLMVESETGGNTALNDFFKNKVADILDVLQMVIDRQKFCSEVHMLVEKCKVG